MIGRYLFFIYFFQSYLFATSISFENIVEEALKKSLELKIVNVDKEITDAKVEEIDSLFYPTLGVGIYQQYSKNIDSNQRAGATIGSTYISGQTQYESSTSFQLDYTLYDFGVRSNKREIAKIERELVDYSLDESTQKLKLKLLDIYSKLLIYSNELKHYQNIKSLQSTMYIQTKRLYDAGEVDRLTLSDRAIEIVELNRKIEESKSNLKEQFEQLSFFTKEQYDLRTNILSFNTNTTLNMNYEDSFTHKSFQAKKEQKEYELELLDSQQYPTVNFFGRYNLYGAKKTSIWVSMYHMRPRNYVVGLSVNYKLFEGFKSFASRKRIKAEKLKLELQDQEQQELFVQQQKANKEKVQSIVTQIEQTTKSIEEQTEKTDMLTRLQAQQEIDGLSVLRDKVATIYKQLALDKNLIEQSSKLKEMEILNDSRGGGYE